LLGVSRWGYLAGGISLDIGPVQRGAFSISTTDVTDPVNRLRASAGTLALTLSRMMTP
jgi:hypothetical protein